MKPTILQEKMFSNLTLSFPWNLLDFPIFREIIVCFLQPGGIDEYGLFFYEILASGVSLEVIQSIKMNSNSPNGRVEVPSQL